MALESLKLSALQTAVAMAVASGATSLEAAAVVSAAETPSDDDRAAVRDLGGRETLGVPRGPGRHAAGTRHGGLSERPGGRSLGGSGVSRRTAVREPRRDRGEWSP